MLRRTMGLAMILALLVAGVALAATKTKTFSSGDLAKSIGHGDTLSQKLNIKKKGTIKDVDVVVALQTNVNEDYTFLVRHPNGKTIHLSSGNGASGNGYGSGLTEGCGSTVVFDDEAETHITETEGIDTLLSGPYQPEQRDEVTHIGGLEELDGKKLQGKWELIVTDTAHASGLAELECFKVRARYKVG
jgi:subtilisin-like proprotein convertase family protein